MSDNAARGRAALIVVSIFCALAVVTSMAAGGIALIQRFQQTDNARQTQYEINYAVCSAAAHDRHSLRALVIQADRQLGTPKSAGYQYYKSHPDELRSAHQQTQRNLRVFLPVIKCSPRGRPYNPGG